MGQIYTVKFVPKFINKKRFCDAVAEHLSGDFTDPFDAFNRVCPNAYKDGNTWYADFDGRYAWETVMYDTFQDAFKHLRDGSWMSIYGWDWDSEYGATIISKRDGKVMLKM